MSFSEYVMGGGEGQDRSSLNDTGSTNSDTNRRSRKQKYRDAYDAASKFKKQTDYKAEKEA